MIRVLFAADFKLAKTGIISTATSILSSDNWGSLQFYSNQELSINGKSIRHISQLSNETIDLVFTHAEYSNLPTLQRRFPEAIFHVGDWPPIYWDTVYRIKPFKGILGALRCYLRLLLVSKKTRFAFVTHEDHAGAFAKGFYRSLYIPIGVNPPEKPFANKIDQNSICFSGNFRYQPNLEAANRLIKIVRKNFPSLKLILVGYYANELQQQNKNNLEIYSDVPSVINFLVTRRPIYVSLIETGAGAKNKILEAMASACPIICTPESLDKSIKKTSSIIVVSKDEEIILQIRSLTTIKNNSALDEATLRLAKEILEQRSWNAVAEQLHEELYTR